MELTVNDFFCGAGGMGLGFQQAGYEIKGAWDFDKYAVQSYAANVGAHVKQVDIRAMTWKDVPMAKVWTFGFPCQDLSVAGKAVGLFEGKRSGLFFEVMRLLEETATYAPGNLPAVIVAENVKGLKPYLEVLRVEYAKAGYKMYFQLFQSKYWGVPQSRERYFVVGIRNDISIGFVFPKESTANVPKLSTILDAEVGEKYFIADDKATAIIAQALEKLDSLGTAHATLTPARLDKRQRGPRAKAEEEPMFTLTAQDLHGVIVAEPQINVIGTLEQPGHDERKRVHDPEGISPTLKACCGGDQQVKILDYGKHRVRKLTPTEYGRGQAFPMDTWKAVVSDSQAYKQFGNAVTVTVAKAVAESIKAVLI
ncbi:MULTISPECIES: DNA cytosine methyltransferase [Pelosinus]|uniref:DNA (cytosine-5-)-methyltransferase n=1 Tax=Pelosinus fermentans B4 TaxID=1149862 RepID=I8RMB6_9FIRM|nr:MULTISPECIES: DNA (cytosine-5-)-methyltransferase [Pelosinus]EIW19945.1 DNA-cytosine methyltransferase [Pelosinus fermentans B4]EIW21198.1 DNA-cytosine methyltransferase [Pelosinus fermentans A11]